MCDMVSKKGKNQNIQVFVRLRPLNAREKEIKSCSVVECCGHKEVVIRQTPLESKHTKKFTFDRAFGPNSTQIEVYKNVVSPLIEEVLQGYSCTVFAYGQTGTGKTFTMAGSSMLSDNMNSSTDSRSWQNDPLVGIIPRSLNQLFDELRLTQNEFTIRVSYLEIYNEELFDLLAPSIDEHSTGKIRIFDDPAKKGSVIVQGLEEVPVKSKMEVYKIMEDGQNKRKTAATLMNAQSSRSHTVFSILVHIKEVNIQGEAMLKTGKLNLVDLAGSENISKAGNDKKERARETVNINQSLLTLGRVISALVERTPHIPYRESKLTRLLQDSLGGRTKTSIIATISPGHKDLDETMSTLDYAHRAKNIMNKPEINQRLTQKLAIKGYTDEIDRLRKELFSQREKSGVYLANEKYEEMILRIGQQDQELSENLMKIRAYEDEISKRLIVFENLRGTLINTRRELTTTKSTLDIVRQKFKETKKTLKKSESVCDEKSHIIEIQAKTEQLLTSQALDLLSVAVDTTDDAEKLQNVLEKRRSIDHTIKTSTELFNERMKRSTETFGEIIDKRCDECIEKNSEIIDELNNIGTVNLAATEKMRENVEETFTSMKSIFERIIKLEHVNCSKIDVSQNLHEQNNIKIDKTRVDVRNTFTEIFNILLGEMSNTYTSPTMSLNSLCDDVKQMLQSGSEKKKQIAEHITKNDDQFHITKSKIDEIFTNQSSAINNILQQLQETSVDSDIIRSLKELSEHTSTNKNILLAELGKNVENTEKIFGFYNVAYDECQEQMDKFDKRMNNLNNKQQQITEGFNNGVKRMVDRLDSVLLNVKIENNFAYQNLNEIIKESYNDISSQHETCLKIFDRKRQDLNINMDESCELLSRKVANLTDKNEKLQRMITDLSGFAENAFDSIINDVGRYCFEELEVYSPTGQTPVRKTRSFSKSFVRTSPHDRILERYRKERGLNYHQESLDSSVIELDESDDDALNPVTETDDLMSISEIKPICRWSSEANIKLSKEPPSVEKPKLTKSASSIDFREIELKQFPEKENIPQDKVRSVSKYDRTASSIPVHTRDASKVLSSRNN